MWDADGLWNSSLHVQLGSEAVARNPAYQIRGFAVEVGGVVGIFDVSSPYVAESVNMSAGPMTGFPYRSMAIPPQRSQ